MKFDIIWYEEDAMDYRVVKFSVKRYELYSHYTKGGELKEVRIFTDLINNVADNYALSELIYNAILKERTVAHESN
jgi:hypothetical protein